MSIDTKDRDNKKAEIRRKNLDRLMTVQKVEEPLKNPPKKQTKKVKKEKTLKHKIFIVLKVLLILAFLGLTAIYLFFKTDLFQEYKELWVQTAMTTMNHQYLATWFLSDEEIAEIMKKLEVENNENSNSDNIMVVEIERKEPTVERIKGKGYVGYVIQVPDASKVKLVDGRKSGRGSKLSEIVKQNKALGGINAGGFYDPQGNGAGNVLVDTVIMNKKMLSGNKATRYSLIGLSEDNKLILGKYNYKEAIAAGIESAVEFRTFYYCKWK